MENVMEKIMENTMELAVGGGGWVGFWWHCCLYSEMSRDNALDSRCEQV